MLGISSSNISLFNSVYLQVRKETKLRFSNKSIKNNMTGTVKTKTDKGFGFISRDGEEKDLFFHSSELNGVTFDELQIGATVEFDVADGEKGPSAKNVKLVQAEQA
jgi:cold shock protein